MTMAMTMTMTMTMAMTMTDGNDMTMRRHGMTSLRGAIGVNVFV